MNLKETKKRMNKHSDYQWHQEGEKYTLYNPACIGQIVNVYGHYEAERVSKSLTGAGYKIGKVPAFGAFA